MTFERQIIENLLHNEPFTRKVLPYLKEEYFSDEANKALFRHIDQFINKYNTLPTTNALFTAVEQTSEDQNHYDDIMIALQEVKNQTPVNNQWMLDETEKHCQDRGINNALREAISMSADPAKKGQIPMVLQAALAISFDTNVGHDYFNNAEQRYDELHGSKQKIPFDIEMLNLATKGGVEPKTLNIIIAGCVDPNRTFVGVRYAVEEIIITTQMLMKDAITIFDQGREISVKTPTGYTRVTEFVRKGIYEEYVLTTENNVSLSCNQDHQVMTTFGWLNAKDMFTLQQNTDGYPIHVETEKGYRQANIKKTSDMIPIVDLVLDNDEHAYYTNGITSHNTNVGKSLMMCHFAAAHVLMGKNVLYITMEMSEEKIAQRIDANLLDMSLDDYDKMPKKWFLEQVEKIKNKCGADFKVKEFPNGSAHVGHFRNLLQELALKKNFKPDVIYIDYLQICASSRYKAGSVPTHQRMEYITEEFRALAQELKIPVFSAAQLNREGFDDSDASITDIAASFGLTFTPDWLIMVIETPELADLGQYLVKQEKSRYADKGKMRSFMIGVDKAKMKLFDLADQPFLSGN